MEGSSVTRIISKHSENSMGSNWVHYPYQLRKRPDSKKSPVLPLGSSNGLGRKTSNGSLVAQGSEASKFSCVECPVTPILDTKNCSEVTPQSGSKASQSYLTGDQPQPSCITADPNSNASLHERVGDTIIAPIEDAESQTMSERIEKEPDTSTRKRKNEEESRDESKAINRNERNHSLHSEVGDQEENALSEKCNNSEELVARKKVKEALSIFETIYKKLLQEEELYKKSKQAWRADLYAYKLFNQKNTVLSNGRKHVGSIPGVEVGDVFNLRVELCIVGLHHQHRICVDSIYQGEKRVAVSLVYSRPYVDGIGNSDVLVYSNYGDLKSDSGNLALKNSMDTRTPVRVIHGFVGYPSNNSRATKAVTRVVAYIYDGLYLVEKYWRKKEKNGQYACMFRMKKILGQPELVVEVKDSKRLKSQPRVCTEDVSQGKERIPIHMVNTIDEERPKPFEYITSMLCPPQYTPPPPKGCDCVNGCSDSESCACAVKNGGEIPFNCKGDIVEAKPLIYECGSSCKCPPSCHNRVSQNGIKFQLEIFKTERRGWGVRSRNAIPTGSFICEYIGELLDEKEAQKRTDDDYLFAIGNNYYDEALWEGLNTSIPDLQKGPSSKDDAGFAVDASEYGNVGRFVNHSCTPNIYAQNLLYDHDEKSMPHVVFFAIDDIPPFQELTYDYNYAIDQVYDSAGNIKKKSCYCGSVECTGRLY